MDLDLNVVVRSASIFMIGDGSKVCPSAPAAPAPAPVLLLPAAIRRINSKDFKQSIL